MASRPDHHENSASRRPTRSLEWLLFGSGVRLQHLHQATAPVGARGSNGEEMCLPTNTCGKAEPSCDGTLKDLLW